MSKYGVDFDLVAVKRYASDVQKKYIPAAAGIALKRTGTTVRNRAASRIRERLALRSAVAKGALSTQRIGNGMTLLIIASGRPIPLRDYGARMTKKGATFRVSRSGGRKVYKREGRTGFIVQSRGGHVFVRTTDDPPGPARAHIQKAYGPSVPQYFVTKIVISAMEETARERWPVEFAAALRGVLLRRTGADISQTALGAVSSSL
jgi:hypothetical protein